MGVSGCGKSTVGNEMKSRFNYKFFDGDDFHSESNKIKMANGVPLTDDDRLPWLKTLADIIKTNIENGHDAIIACSSLKREYRQILNINPHFILFVHLKISFQQADERLQKRSGHFFDVNLLKSQFDTLQDLTNDETLNFAEIECDNKTNNEIVQEIYNVIENVKQR